MSDFIAEEQAENADYPYEHSEWLGHDEQNPFWYVDGEMVFVGDTIPVNEGECFNALQMGAVVCVREDHCHGIGF